MATEQTIAEGFDDFMEKIRNGLFGGQVTVTRQYDKSKCSFEVTIAPSGGNHREGEYVFEIVMECIGGPQINCQTAIYHPNIDITKNDGKLRINLKSDLSAQDVVNRLLDVMQNPEFWNSHLEIDSSDSAEVLKFWNDVETSIAGGRVDDYVFPVNARYARLHDSAIDAGERTEEHVEGLDLIEKHFGIKQYVESTPDDDEGNGDDDDDDEE